MTLKNSENLIWQQMKSSPATPPIAGTGSQSRALPKLLVFLILFVSVTYLVYMLKLISSAGECHDEDEREPLSIQQRPSSSFIKNQTVPNLPRKPLKPPHGETEIQDIVFGIATSAKLWKQRKDYIKLWFKPKEMRAIVWVDEAVKTNPEEEGLPPVMISGDTSKFSYRNRKGHRSAIRISRIVSETFRLGMENVRWFVMGDDDTVFITENLVRVLRKYDHNQFYYIGSLSESHLQNIEFSYSMAYGGGGFAISYPLAKAVERMQDRCIERYPGLYGSDDRMQACMAELGVPLTKELGFHQYDVYGNLFGLLSAHPVTPLVSLHHLEVVEPIFPDSTRTQALRRLFIPMSLDSAALLQQSICYDKSKGWTISVSWGFAVQIFRGVFSPREIEMPSRTFLNWYKKADYTAYAFNTRPVSRNPCQKPFVFYLSNATFNSSTDQTVTEYLRNRVPHPFCKWKMADPADLDVVQVFKKPNPRLWESSPRRNCCRIMEMKKKGVLGVDVGRCREGEISELL